MELGRHFEFHSSVNELKPVHLPIAVYNPAVGGRIPEPVNTESVGQIIADTTAFLQALETKHKSRVDAFEEWDRVRLERLEKQKRDAAEYSEVLEPTRRRVV